VQPYSRQGLTRALYAKDLAEAEQPSMARRSRFKLSEALWAILK